MNFRPLLRPLALSARSIKGILGTLFGSFRFAWSPPGWLRLVIRSRRLILLAIVVFAGAGALRGWQRQYINEPQRPAADPFAPQPFTLAQTVPVPPPETKPTAEAAKPAAEPAKPRPDVVELTRDTSKPTREVKATVSASSPRWDERTKKPVGPAIVIRFSSPAAPLGLVGKPAPASAVKLLPEFPGVWRWQSSQELVFEAQGGWMPRDTYEAKLDPAALAPDCRLNFDWPWFVTPELTATFGGHTYYIDPATPQLQQTVTSVMFNRPVARDELLRNLSITNMSGLELFAPGSKPQVLVDEKSPLHFYIRSPLIKTMEKEDLVVVRIAPSLQPIAGGEPMGKEALTKVNVPSRYSAFFFKSVSPQIVKIANGEPRQFLFLQSSIGANSGVISKAAEAWELPPPRKDKDGNEVPWVAADVTPDVLAKAKRVALEFAAGDGAPASLEMFSFKLAPRASGPLYVRVPKETPAPGGFATREDFAEIVEIPPFPRDTRILGKGGILALNGERKLSVASRGFGNLRFTLARVPANQINHLVSQTNGSFESPGFRRSFGFEDMAHYHSTVQPIAKKNDHEMNYSAFDFAPSLARVEPAGEDAQRGLFYLTVDGVRRRTPKDAKPSNHDPDPEWIAGADRPANDEADEEEGEENNEEDAQNDRRSDSRFVLITDLGIIVKRNADGSREVFVQSFKDRVPVAEVRIVAIARNGEALAEAATDAQGRAMLSSLDGLKREKAPVAIIARKAADLAFIPWAREDRQLEFTRFDIDGVPASQNSALDAFLFTERGIYRPGDPIKLAAIVRQRDWSGALEGLPVEVVLMNAKEEEAGRFPTKLPADGFIELTLPTNETSPTGVWRIELRRAEEKKKKNRGNEGDEEGTTHLGSTMVRVEEFQPDRLKLIAKLSPTTDGAWLSPEQLTAEAELQTLFGIAAAERRVTAKLRVAPGAPIFEQWPGWTFSLPKHERFEPREVDLGELDTDEKGHVKFPLALDAYTAPLLRISVDLEGFEADGGRGVRGALGALVSSQPRLLGWKSDGDMDFIGRDVPCNLQLVAIGPDSKPTTAPGLKRVLIETRHASVLTKQDNGNFAYVSREQEKEIESSPESLPAQVSKIPLPTKQPGRFRYEWRDEQGIVLCAVHFNVVGTGEQARGLERDAELEMTLPDKVWRPGEELEVSMRAPYAGSGLITIERDKVLAAQWFKSDNASSVQRIKLPEGIEGGAYVNIACVRALDSAEIFTSPLSSGVAPFRVAPDRRVIPVTLDVPERVKPGEKVKIGFSTPRRARVVVWAVDEGIHRVTSYRSPQPLSKLLRKPSLEVGTWQLLDLLMPEFTMLKNARAFGGDGDEPPELKLGLNPFKRKRNAPVVYWSGIIESGPERREVAYDVPDYFAGRLNIFAAAVVPDAVGVAEKQTLVKGPLVLTPNAPFFTAPDDEFTASLTVANQLEGANATDQVSVAAETQGGIEIIEAPQGPLTIAPGKEVTARFRVRTKHSLGNAELKFTATAGNERVVQRATMSVRPATPRSAIVQSGWFRKDEHDIPVVGDFHSEFLSREAVVSTTPLGLARGLAAYLREYPHGCSEQITSRAFPWLVLRDDASFGLDKKEAEGAISHTIAMLANRQNEDGGFGYWTSRHGDGGFDYLSVYVTQFLTEAKASGFTVPGPMFDAALRRMRLMADAKLELKPENKWNDRAWNIWQLRSEANTQAGAIYLLTRNEEVTTNYALKMRDALESQIPGKWHQDPSAAWLSATWRLLKKDEEAKKLIELHRKAKAGRAAEKDWRYYYESPLSSEATTFTVLCRHFPEIAGNLGYDELRPITELVERGDFHTLSAAWCVMALKSYSALAKDSGVRAGIAEVRDGAAKQLAEPRAGMVTAKFGSGPQAVRFLLTRTDPASKLGAWYQTIETGFDRSLPAHPETRGLEVFRELLDEAGNVVAVAKVGETMRIRVRVRNSGAQPQPHLAVSELLPGAFDFAPQGEKHALKPGLGTVPGTEYVDVREDRAMLFCALGAGETRTFEYAVRPTCAGTFTMPPSFAESMYDRTIRGRGVASKLTVLARE